MGCTSFFALSTLLCKYQTSVFKFYTWFLFFSSFHFFFLICVFFCSHKIVGSSHKIVSILFLTSLISFFYPSCIRPSFPLPVNICHKASPFLDPERLLFSIEKWVHPSPFLMYCISIYCLFFFFPVENLPVPLRVSLPSSTGFRPFPVESSFPCF